MLKNQLPPLEPLIAFEAAARLLSFTAAAGELNLTQAAISQQIRSLEQRIGVRLFTRAHRSVRLTAAGQEYQHTVSAMLNHLASATDDIKSETASVRICIASDQSFAALWLVPRLHLFRQLHPEIGIRLIASDVDSECLADDVQTAILLGDGNWPGYQTTPLFPEEVFPVCSPGYLRRRDAEMTLQSLANETLLELTDFHWNWMNWRSWLSKQNIDLPTAQRAVQINNYPLLIESAKTGMGIALGWGTLVDEELQSGRLIRPIQESIGTAQSYFLLQRDERTSEQAAQFCQWLTDQFAESTTLR